MSGKLLGRLLVVRQRLVVHQPVGRGPDSGQHDHRSDVLAIPIPVVDLGSDESSGQVTLVTPENRIAIRKVQLGMQTANNIEIRSGLHAGDLVITGNRSGLREGQEVRPKLLTVEGGH